MLKKIIASILLCSTSCLSAHEVDLGRVIAQHLARGRGMISIEDAGIDGVVIGSHYASSVCRKTLQNAIKRGKPLNFDMADDAVIPLKYHIVDEGTYHLSSDFISKNKADIALLAAAWNVSVKLAADFVRESDIQFHVYKKEFPLFAVKRHLSPDQNVIDELAGTTPPSRILVIPYATIYVTKFTYKEKRSNGLGANAEASAALTSAKAELDLGFTRNTDGTVTLPDKSVVAFKPLIEWSSAECGRSI